MTTVLAPLLPPARSDRPGLSSSSDLVPLGSEPRDDGASGVLASRPLATLAHELRNPLAAALTGVAVAAEMTDPADPRAALLQRAAADLQRAASVLSAYLQACTGGSVGGTSVDLRLVCDTVAARRLCSRRADRPQEPNGGEPSFTVRVRSAACDRVPVRADPVLLERVLDNLIDNAGAAGAATVELWLDATVDEGKAVVHVADDGEGVPRALRERLFDAAVSGRGSSGLGLTIAREVVERHGGTLALCREHGAADAEGGRHRGGACFRISLPLATFRADA